MVMAATELRNIRKHAEAIKNDEPHTIATMSPGDCWAQGDLLIVSLATLPKDCQKMLLANQLAPGATQGSRHCLVSLDGVTMFRLKDATPLDGPIIEAMQAIEIDHPEHGAICLPAGVYGVIYQRQYADDLRRVQD